MKPPRVASQRLCGQHLAAEVSSQHTLHIWALHIHAQIAPRTPLACDVAGTQYDRSRVREVHRAQKPHASRVEGDDYPSLIRSLFMSGKLVGSSSTEGDVRARVSGFALPTSNTTYTPNQFFRRLPSRLFPWMRGAHRKCKLRCQ